MPKIFSEEDRGRIRARLLERGRELFTRKGLRATSVEELAASVGIAKGTFYHFFGTKEALCYAILETEDERHSEDLAQIISRHPGSEEALRELLRWGFRLARGDSFLLGLRKSGDFALLMRSVSSEAILRHKLRDEERIGQFLDAIGISDPERVRIATALIRGALALTLHEEDLGGEGFAEMAEILGAMIASYAAGSWVPVADSLRRRKRGDHA